MLTIRAMANGEGYAARHLAHSDYYAEGERVTGQWFGRGAQLLGLSGEVQFKDFEAVGEGLDPVPASSYASAIAPTAFRRWLYPESRPQPLRLHLLRPEIRIDRSGDHWRRTSHRSTQKRGHRSAA